MEKPPLVSVITPCHNMEKYVAETVQSVRNQTYSHWEMLIVCDASTDGTVDILKSLAAQDERIKLTIINSHSGIAEARNQAIKQAQGHYLAFLDADDLWHPEKLERQLRFMQEKHIGFSYSSYDLVNENGVLLNKSVNARKDMNYRSYLRNTIIGCSTVMIDTDIVGPVIVPDFRTSEDTATWLNILRQGYQAYVIPQPLVSYRIRSKSASSNKLKASHDLWTVYRRQEKMSFFKALFYFCCYVFNAIKKRILS